MVSAEQDVWQRQPDIRRPGMGENMASSGNMSHAVEWEQSGGLVTNSEEYSGRALFTVTVIRRHNHTSSSLRMTKSLMK